MKKLKNQHNNKYRIKYRNLIKMKDKIKASKIIMCIISKRKKNLIKNLALRIDKFQKKEDLI